MHDQLGGGFHRYSVDDRWFVPHFEKMLYDQAQLAISYLEGFQITRPTSTADIARDIFDYVLRDMTDPERRLLLGRGRRQRHRSGASRSKRRRRVLHLVRTRSTPFPKIFRVVLLPLRRGARRQRAQRSARRVHREEHPVPGHARGASAIQHDQLEAVAALIRPHAPNASARISTTRF